jgi:hypothetical protein
MYEFVRGLPPDAALGPQLCCIQDTGASSRSRKGFDPTELGSIDALERLAIGILGSQRGRRSGGKYVRSHLNSDEWFKKWSWPAVSNHGISATKAAQQFWKRDTEGVR